MRDVPVLRVLPISQVEGARRTFDWALQTEKVHAGMCREAKQAMDEGIDLISTSACSVAIPLKATFPTVVLSATPKGRDSSVFRPAGLI